MHTYNINYTDPLRTSFSIAPGAHNGPGSPAPKTTLGLYGRGAHEWGEAINENFVRLVENFASATPPLSPVSGQVWVKQKLYWKNSDVALPATGALDVNAAPTGAFYKYDTDGDAWITGANFPVSVINRSSGIPNFVGVLGQHVFNIFDQTMYLWETPYKQATAMWIPREMSVASTASPIDGLVIPVSGTTVPEYSVHVYDQYADVWTLVALIVDGNIELGSQTYPLPDSNNAATIEYVNTGLSGVIGSITEAYLGTILDGRYVNTSGDTMTGLLTLSGAPTANLHAATKLYVDTADGTKVSKSGDTMTGSLTLSGAPTVGLHAATKQYVDDINTTLTTAVNGKVSKAGDTMTGLLTLSGAPTNNLHAATKLYVDTADGTKVAKAGDTMTGFLTLHADPTNNMHAATKQYVDSSAAASRIFFLAGRQQLTLNIPALNTWYAHSLVAFIPAGATAVILQGEGALWGPDFGDVDAHVKVRQPGTTNEFALLRGRANGSDDSVAVFGFGMFPIDAASRSVELMIETPGFTHGVQVYVVGYIT